MSMEEQYKPQEIEETAQAIWEEKKCFQVTEDVNKEKFYCLTMFPYPAVICTWDTYAFIPLVM